MRADIAALCGDMTEMKFDLLKWIVGLAFAQMGLLVVLLVKLH